jgi:hypothetical protein
MIMGLESGLVFENVHGLGSLVLNVHGLGSLVLKVLVLKV